MGFTGSSGWIGALRSPDTPGDVRGEEWVVALAGNPNTGKSTVFNSLTGLNQHTGNWPGKTVVSARGSYEFSGGSFALVDLPGTYSLLSNSVEEEVARNFICFEKPRATVVVADATCLERNLNLVLQILEMTTNVVLCVNLMDEAKRKQIRVDVEGLSKSLGVPVVGTNARDGIGLEELKSAVLKVCTGEIHPEPILPRYDFAIERAVETLLPQITMKEGMDRERRWVAIRLLEGDPAILDSIKQHWFRDEARWEKICQRAFEIRKNFSDATQNWEQLRDKIVSALVNQAEEISQRVVTLEKLNYHEQDRKIDRILTSKLFGIPIMLGLLGIVFWLTISGANYPSEVLAKGSGFVEDRLTEIFIANAWPQWIYGVLIQGIYKTCAWVVSVMLPPMAIFFPLFTLLEDLGYLPRVAFNLDNFFKKACAHGKQALTMCMGFGCNAAGIIACRIIDSPRERLIAIITNNFVPCNGRFPTLIALSTIFIAGAFDQYRSVVAALALLTAIVIGVLITLMVSKMLSSTILKGLPSSFALELPPYRPPQVGRILVRSLLDRTLFVLTRAVVVAAPAGMILWIMANVSLNGNSLLTHGAGALEPFARFMGLDGYILLAFILGFPANEIVIPIIIMSYMSTGTLLELEDLSALRALLVANGWTNITAICTMLFALNHFPCGTTLLTIYKETRSIKWTVLSFIIPTLMGIVICAAVAQTAGLLGMTP